MHEELLKIDPMQLDVEWVEQPGRYMYWAEQSAEARASADWCKFLLDKREAEISSEIRTDPSKFKIDKVTEAAVSTAVRIHPDIERLNKKLIKLRKEAEILARLVTALDQRKKALENLVFLNNQGYNAQPVVKQERKTRGVKK